MSAFPDDVYTEQSVDPDTLANLGPLRRLAGIWESQAGIDINPKAEGPQSDASIRLSSYKTEIVPNLYSAGIAWQPARRPEAQE